MLCEKCKINEATGLYDGGGNRAPMYLCTKCMLDKQNELLTELDVFAGFVGLAPAPAGRRLRCASCGTDIKSVTKTLFVGCADCYKYFKDELKPIIKNIQNATAHVGSMPQADKSGSEVQYIQGLLDKAIKEERFEDAAALSRRLKALMEGR